MMAVGYTEIEAFWKSLRNALPSATFTIHHKIGREDPFLPPRAALRWSLVGKHEGKGGLATHQMQTFILWNKPRRIWSLGTSKRIYFI